MGFTEYFRQKREAQENEEAQLERQRQEALKEEQLRLDAERQRWADKAIPPHPLRGRDSVLLDDYVRGQLVLRNEGKTLDVTGALLRSFSISLGIPLEHFANLEKEVSYYDDQSKRETLLLLSDLLKQPDEVICFMCDFVRLHGDSNSLAGEFLELWQDICVGVFHVDRSQRTCMELLGAKLASGSRRKKEDDFGSIPDALIDYYLQPCTSQLIDAQPPYLVIDLSGGVNASRYPIRYTFEQPNLSDASCCTTELWLRRIPAGDFIMGSPENELGHKNDEIQHHVTLTQEFFIGVFPCTQRQYELVTGKNPSNYKNVEHPECLPVEQVTYNNLRGSFLGSKWPSTSEIEEDSFFGRLQKRTGLLFDLPTEAQWEYACRAGTTTALNNGENITTKLGNCPNLDAVCWHFENSDGRPHPVGQKQPNAWGLYDMHGNVWEWCLDWYGDYPNTPVENPQGGKSGSSRVLRGGSWSIPLSSLFSWYFLCYWRSAFRNEGKPFFASSDCGFRIALRL